MSTALLAQAASTTREIIAPTTLVRDAAPGVAVQSTWTTLSTSPWPWMAGAAILFVLAVLARAWVVRRREDPADRAFRSLARRLRLGSDQRTLVMRLAATSSASAPVHPVALLLSQTAFLRAADHAARAGEKWLRRPDLPPLHAAIFAARPTT